MCSFKCKYTKQTVYDCNIMEFRCDDGMCVNYSNTCDGIRHCKDGSDERYCNQAGEITSHIGITSNTIISYKLLSLCVYVCLLCL